MQRISTSSDAQTTSSHPQGAWRRRGPFRSGERVQITDSKGQHFTVLLTPDGYFQSRRGSFPHAELIGKPEGTVLHTQSGHRLLCLRPLLPDFVLSMPRGATVIYPKDAGQIIGMADVYPGARVLEAGAGSGALTISLLAAVGESGQVLSVEKRPEFADIARGNVDSWYGGQTPPWELKLGELSTILPTLEPLSFDRVILDMLAPWEHVVSAARVLEPGGVFLCYIATTTQMSRVVEALRDSGMYTEPSATETLVRSWHVEGLAVRPDHRMVAHTGFLVQARRLAQAGEGIAVTRRPAPAAQNQPLPWQAETGEEVEWEEADLQLRTISPRKLRKVHRDVAARYALEGLSAPLPYTQPDADSSSAQQPNSDASGEEPEA